VEASARRGKGRELADRARKLTAVVDALGDRLAHVPDDAPGSDAIARLFHDGLEQLRDAEMALEVGP
jgi:vacuolar-type H+-ATPase subunit E/Vma4